MVTEPDPRGGERVPSMIIRTAGEAFNHGRGDDHSRGRCAECGADFARRPGSRGPMPRRCPHCLPPPVRVVDRQGDYWVLVCQRCGCPFTRPSRRGQVPRYCGDACRDATRRETEWARRQGRPRQTHDVTCFCGAWFTTWVSRRFCSKRCWRAYRYRANRTKLRAAAAAMPPCTSVDCDSPQRAKGLCSTHYNQTRPERYRSKGDPARRQAAWQARRAVKRGVDAEMIKRDDVGDRDGWRCGICGQKVNQRLRYPDPRSASLDHVEPLSMGGRHVLSNVRISHLACNVQRSNIIHNDQLALL